CARLRDRNALETWPADRQHIEISGRRRTTTRRHRTKHRRVTPAAVLDAIFVGKPKELNMILITGGTGTSGVPIVQAVLALGERPRVLARDPLKAAKLLGDEVEISRGDLNDPQSLDAAMEDVDRALLLSAPAQDQIQLQKNFIDAAARNRVRH